ncbi:hypothetical protein H0H92_000235, partial [Tricholoma furcatifolium]
MSMPLARLATKGKQRKPHHQVHEPHTMLRMYLTFSPVAAPRPKPRRRPPGQQRSLVDDLFVIQHETGTQPNADSPDDSAPAVPPVLVSGAATPAAEPVVSAALVPPAALIVSAAPAPPAAPVVSAAPLLPGSLPLAAGSSIEPNPNAS